MMGVGALPWRRRLAGEAMEGGHWQGKAGRPGTPGDPLLPAMKGAA